MYEVTVKPKNKWRQVTAASKFFQKGLTTYVPDVEMTDELKTHSMLEHKHVKDPVVAEATNAALKMMADAGLRIADVRGTGKDGRITEPDVRRTLAKLKDAAESDGDSAE